MLCATKYQLIGQREAAEQSVWFFAGLLFPVVAYQGGPYETWGISRPLPIAPTEMQTCRNPQVDETTDGSINDLIRNWCGAWSAIRCYRSLSTSYS